MRIFEVKSIWTDISSESETLAANLAFTVDSFKIRNERKTSVKYLNVYNMNCHKVNFCNILEDFFILDFVY